MIRLGADRVGKFVGVADHQSSAGHRDARYIVRAFAPVSETTPAGLADEQSALVEGLAGGSTGRVLNFLFGDNNTEEKVRACYEPEVYRRLLAVKRHYDPANLLRLGRALTNA